MIIRFCGHSRHIGDVKDGSKLLALFEELSNGEDITFYLGGYGDFDIFCKNCAKRYKTRTLM